MRLAGAKLMPPPAARSNDATANTGRRSVLARKEERSRRTVAAGYKWILLVTSRACHSDGQRQAGK